MGNMLNNFFLKEGGINPGQTTNGEKNLTNKEYKKIVEEQVQIISDLKKQIDDLKRRMKMFLDIFESDGFSVKKISSNDAGLIFMVIKKVDVSNIFELRIFHCWSYHYCIASAMYHITPDHIELNNLNTLNGYEGKGYGSELIKEIIDVARAENKNVLGGGRVREGELEHTKRFFEQRGFQVQYNPQKWCMQISWNIDMDKED